MNLKEHALGEIDDDGHRDPLWRHYRYVCRCGKAGPWQPSRVLACGNHAVHCLDAKGAS